MIERNCERCAKPFFTYPCRIKINQGRHCSIDCANKAKAIVLIGKKRSYEQRQRISFSLKGKSNGRFGAKHPRWIADRTKLQQYNDDNKDRRSYAYSYWRKQVWLRDNFKCKIENPDCKGRIEAHHILSWKEYPELRYEINNGITLCHAHHPRERAEEKRMQEAFQQLVSSVSKV